MKHLISNLVIIISICFFSNKTQAQEGYTYTLIDNGLFNYTIAAVPNASTSNFATSVQSYGLTIILPNGVTATITSSLGNGAGATFFDGSAVGQSSIDGYLITETLGSPVSLPAPASGTAYPIVSILIDDSNIEVGDAISILANDSALATTVTPLKSFMSADMIDDGSAIFSNVVDANASGLSGTTSYVFPTLSTSTEEFIDFSVYPNPTTDNLYINQINNLIKVEVFNVNGQLVLTKASDLTTIKMSHLQSGVYLVKVYTEKAHKTIKIIKE